MARTTEGPTLESEAGELTPELALVDPELAQRARDQLPADAPLREPETEPPEPAPPVVGRIPPAEQITGSLQPESAAPEQPPPRRRRRIGRFLVFAAALLGAVGGAVALAAFLVEGRTAAPSGGPTFAAPTTAPAPADTSDVPATPAATGPRSFGWVPVARASHYHVAFFRGGEKIFETWPRRPPLVLQPRWTFKGRPYSLSPGEYRWVVRPGFGPRRAARYGQPVVDASLLISR